MKANKLCINAQKSTALLIPSKRNSNGILNNNEKISVCKAAKSLCGVMISCYEAKLSNNDVRSEYTRGAPEPSMLQIPIDI